MEKLSSEKKKNPPFKLEVRCTCVDLIPSAQVLESPLVPASGRSPHTAGVRGAGGGPALLRVVPQLQPRPLLACATASFRAGPQFPHQDCHCSLLTSPFSISGTNRYKSFTFPEHSMMSSCQSSGSSPKGHIGKHLLRSTFMMQPFHTEVTAAHGTYLVRTKNLSSFLLGHVGLSRLWPSAHHPKLTQKLSQVFSILSGNI